jgi:hypothetical protein
MSELVVRSAEWDRVWWDLSARALRQSEVEVIPSVMCYNNRKLSRWSISALFSPATKEMIDSKVASRCFRFDNSSAGT